MKLPAHSVSGRRLKKYGIAATTLAKVHVLSIRWLPFVALTVPIPFDGCMILAHRKALDRELDGALADSPALAILVHQYCHAHQRLEWGFFPYAWRHLLSRLVPRGEPVRFRQVERECYAIAQAVIEAHAKETPGREEENGNDEVSKNPVAGRGPEAQ